MVRDGPRSLRHQDELRAGGNLGSEDGGAEAGHSFGLLRGWAMNIRVVTGELVPLTPQFTEEQLAELDAVFPGKLWLRRIPPLSIMIRIPRPEQVW